MTLPEGVSPPFLLVLAGFALGSTILSVTAILNSLRLRNVRLSWNAGKLGGYPFFSTLFLLVALLMGVVVWLRSHTAYYPVVAGYLWIGANWYTASLLASRRYITDYGIVKNINNPSQTVAWCRILDYVQKPETAGTQYIFIYTPRGRCTGPGHCVRLELRVPARKRAEFDKIVSYKLGKTINPGRISLLETGMV